jgi:hypothetical protein
MNSLYQASGVSCPWTYRQEMDGRTYKQALNIESPDHVGVNHNALDDAIWLHDVLVAGGYTSPEPREV